jgi:hypothetical protein
MPTNNTNLEKNLWAAADELRANSKLRAADYSIPVLGLIFLKYADQKFAHATEQFGAEASGAGQRRRDPLSSDRYKVAEKLLLDWQKRQQSHAAVWLTRGDTVRPVAGALCGGSLRPETGRYLPPRLHELLRCWSECVWSCHGVRTDAKQRMERTVECRLQCHRRQRANGEPAHVPPAGRRNGPSALNGFGDRAVAT